jgi:hypothetical protein
MRQSSLSGSKVQSVRETFSPVQHHWDVSKGESPTETTSREATTEPSHHRHEGTRNCLRVLHLGVAVFITQLRSSSPSKNKQSHSS